MEKDTPNGGTPGSAPENTEKPRQKSERELRQERLSKKLRTNLQRRKEADS